ncbi:MAG: hypothetical protein KF729_24975 [Sandaracinaceae bacterium]|nr:hypothetical protein [Sandaracinaceae bacterium]
MDLPAGSLAAPAMEAVLREKLVSEVGARLGEPAALAALSGDLAAEDLSVGALVEHLAAPVASVAPRATS